MKFQYNITEEFIGSYKDIFNYIQKRAIACLENDEEFEEYGIYCEWLAALVKYKGTRKTLKLTAKNLFEDIKIEEYKKGK